MQVMLMRLMSKGEYLIVPKGTKFKGLGKLGLSQGAVKFPFKCPQFTRVIDEGSISDDHVDDNNDAAVNEKEEMVLLFTIEMTIKISKCQ